MSLDVALYVWQMTSHLLCHQYLINCTMRSNWRGAKRVRVLCTSSIICLSSKQLCKMCCLFGDLERVLQLTHPVSEVREWHPWLLYMTHHWINLLHELWLVTINLSSRRLLSRLRSNIIILVWVELIACQVALSLFKSVNVMKSFLSTILFEVKGLFVLWYVHLISRLYSRC